MLTLAELTEIFDRLGTPDAGRQLVEKARRESPVRKPQSRLGNVITFPVSKKMNGAVIQTESQACEFPAAIQYEQDKLVFEYLAQPCRVDLLLTDGGRKKRFRLQHIPDFLLITYDALILEEWREEERLERLAKQSPGRYIKELDGWHFPEAEAQLAAIGITYRLRSGSEIPMQYVRNVEFLADFFGDETSSLEPKTVERLRQCFHDSAELSLAGLIHDVEGITSDDVYKAIADGIIKFDFYNDDIAETQRARVYRDEAAFALLTRLEFSAPGEPSEELIASIEVDAEVDYDGRTWRISLVGDEHVILTGEEGTTELSLDLLERLHRQKKLAVRSTGLREVGTRALRNLPPQEVDRIISRLEILEQAALSPSSAPVSRRTLQRWRKRMRENGETLSEQTEALASFYANCGNRERKIPRQLIECIAEIVRTKINTPTAKSNTSAYKDFVDACETAGLRPCSSKTFSREVRLSKSTHARQGKRAAYAKAPIIWYLNRDRPIHGVRPFEYVHIDHTPIEINVRLPGSKKTLGTVWLTVAIDAESRRIVGFYLSLETPSYRSCMMVLRDIVRRHGRLPYMLILDNGADFRSRALARLARQYRMALRFRPAGQPRHGAVMERVFGTAQTQLIHNLEGNTKVMKHVRTVTKSVRPEQFVEWTLPALHGALDYYFELLYGKEIHPAHGEEPVEHFHVRMRETGMRLNRLVQYDRRFLIETCPPPGRSTTRVVDGQRGIKVNHIWYWCDEFRLPSIHRKKVEVRVDPWDPGHVYILSDNQWYQCRSQLAASMRNHTALEIRYAVEELAKKEGVKLKDLTPARAAEWLHVMVPANFDSRLHHQQSEMKRIYGPLGMTSVAPAETCVPMLELIGSKENSEVSSPSVATSSNENEPTPVEDTYELF